MVATNCANCGSTATGAYCAACGQGQRDHRRSLFGWAREAVGEQFHMNAALPLTLWLLIVRPGELTAEWIRGRRVRYLSPLQLYLLATLVLIAVAALFSWPTRFEVAVSETHRQLVLTAFRNQLRQSVPLIVLMAVPLLAGLVWLLVRKGYFVEYLVFSIHTHSFFFLSGALVWVLNAYVPQRSMVVLPWLLLCGWYLHRSMRTAFAHSARGTQVVLIVLVYFYVVIAAAERILDRFGEQTVVARQAAIEERRARSNVGHSLEQFRHVMNAHYTGDTATLGRALARTIIMHNDIGRELASPAVRYRRAKLYLLASRIDLAEAEVARASAGDTPAELRAAPDDLLMRMINTELALATGDSVLARRRALNVLNDLDRQLREQPELQPYQPELERFRALAQRLTQGPPDRRR